MLDMLLFDFRCRIVEDDSKRRNTEDSPNKTQKTGFTIFRQGAKKENFGKVRHVHKGSCTSFERDILTEVQAGTNVIKLFTFAITE